MKKNLVIVGISWLSSLIFFYTYNILHNAGLSIIWMPKALSIKLGVERNTFVDLLNSYYKNQIPAGVSVDNSDVWYWLVGNGYSLFAILSFIFFIIGLYYLIIFLKKSK